MACEKLGQAPERPASGKLMLRVPPAVHASALRAAELAGKSLNQWATQVLSEAARTHAMPRNRAGRQLITTSRKRR